MPITVICSGCKKRLKAKDSLAGRTVACPGCGTKLTIGAADDLAADLLLDTKPSQSTEAAPAPVREPEPDRVPPKSRSPRAAKTPAPPHLPAPISVPPLTTHETPPWLRHLHWVLVLSMIPLAFSLLHGREDKDVAERLLETIEQAPAEAQKRAMHAIADLEEGKGSLDDVFDALPDHKLVGAFLPRDTWAHWLITFAAAGLFVAFLFALSTEGSAQLRHLLLLGLFTATIGIVLLLAVQFVAAKTQGVFIIPRGLIGILFWIVQAIGFSYRAAADPQNGFFLSFIGFTLGVGLCEELCKALPIIIKYREPNDQTWLGAYLWGLASGAAFGLAEAIIYASDFYNGIHGASIYFVRNISCVALHALWTGSAAITIHRRQHLFQQEMAWHDWLVRSIAVVAVPMVLHGLYDTLLKKEMNALALGVAVVSFLYLAFQISRLRGSDDQAAHEDFLKSYQRRRLGQ